MEAKNIDSSMPVLAPTDDISDDTGPGLYARTNNKAVELFSSHPILGTIVVTTAASQLSSRVIEPAIKRLELSWRNRGKKK